MLRYITSVNRVLQQLGHFNNGRWVRPELSLCPDGAALQGDSKALSAQLLTPCLYWNHKHDDQMHGWISGRASNPLEIECRPINLSEEILASNRHTNTLQIPTVNKA